MVYDALGQMLALTNEIGKSTTYSYDAVGQTKTRQFRNGDKTTYLYDAMGRETTRQYMNNSRVTFAYDAGGNVTTMLDLTGTTTYSYDALDRISGKSDPGPIVQSYAYDAASQRTKLTDPDGNVRTYTYDNSGRTKSLQTLTAYTTFTYDADGRRTVVARHGTGATVETTTYDNAGRILNRIAKAQRVTYTYDGNGNPLTKIDLNFPHTYTYDALDQLVKDACQGTSYFEYTYTYDSVGNRTFSSETGPTQMSYDVAGRMVTLVDNAKTNTFTYDNNGNQYLIKGWLPPNMATAMTVTMTYDYENRMTSNNYNGSILSYTYSGDGLKRAEFRSGVWTTLVWDGDEYLGEV